MASFFHFFQKVSIYRKKSQGVVSENNGLSPLGRPVHDSFNVLRRIRFGKISVSPGGPMILQDFSAKSQSQRRIEDSSYSSNQSQLNPEELLDRGPCELEEVSNMRPFRGVLPGIPKQSVALTKVEGLVKNAPQES